MNRRSRTQLAEETVQIIERGTYETPSGKIADIGDAIHHAIERTVLYTPARLDDLVSEWTGRPQSNRNATQFAVTNETTLDAARRLIADQGRERVLCLNFASARSPGGGFLNGSQAQEESLARSSALYASLIACDAYYESNRRCGTALYTDHMILSPDVPVFRTDSGALLEAPYRASFLTVPAVNAGAVSRNERENVPRILSVMSARTEKLPAVAASNGYAHLVLGAWGCGVFQNRPVDVARLFTAALTGEGPFTGAFESVTFAVLDRSNERYIITPFEQAFGMR